MTGATALNALYVSELEKNRVVLTARITELESDLANACGRIEAEQGIYAARIAELEAENAELKIGVNAKHYMVCLSCSRPMSEGTWRAIDLPVPAVRCPCGAQGNWARGHFFWRERAKKAEAENARLREALTPSASTKQAFIGEFTTYQLTGMDNDGNEVWGEVLIPWTSIKDIMKAIYARATLNKETEAGS